MTSLNKSSGLWVCLYCQWSVFSRPSLARRCLSQKSSRPKLRPTSKQKLPPPSDKNVPPPSNDPEPPRLSVSQALAAANDSENNLLAPVYIPEDPHAVLKDTHPAAELLGNSGLVVQRQFEMMNIFLGVEQANRYIILDPHGNHVGYLAEHHGGIAKTMGRQFFKTHRAFTTHVFNKEKKEVLRFHRPFSWVNTRIGVYDPIAPGSLSSSGASVANTSTALVSGTAELPVQISPLPISAMRIIGEAQSEWAPLRRKYHLHCFHQSPKVIARDGTRLVPPPTESRQMEVAVQSGSSEGQYVQFAHIDEQFLAWDFTLRSESDQVIGSVNRNFAGWGREIFTDTGVYALRMDAAGLEKEASQKHLISQTGQKESAYKDVVAAESPGRNLGMTLDQRAVMLATAVTVDYDYFSRQSSSGGGMGFPLWFWWGGGEAGAGTAGAAGAAGAAEAEGAAGAVMGGAGRTVGGVSGSAGEGAMAGAGSMAGYEAMQRGMGGQGDDASPQNGQSDWVQQDQPSQQSLDGNDDVWGSGGQDPWSDNQGGQDPWSSSSGGGDGGGGGEGGSGFWDMIWNMFFGD